MNLNHFIPKSLQRFSPFAIAQTEVPTEVSAKSSIICRNFGQPEPVLDGHALFEYGYCPKWTDWYDLPYDMLATAKLFRATSHHTSALIVKRNILTSDFIPHPLLSRHDFNTLALKPTLANCYANIKRNRFGGIVGIGSRPALNMRRGLGFAKLLPN